MEERIIKPSKGLYALPPVIILIGIISFMVLLTTGLNSSMSKINNQVVVPGTEIINLNEAGKYSIYLEHRSIVDGEVYETKDISGLVCKLTDMKTGEVIQLGNSTVNSNYSLSGREGRSLFDFTIDEPGEYEITGLYESGAGEEVVLAFGKGFAGSLTKTILSSIGMLFASFGLAIGVFIYVFTKRRKQKNMLATHSGATF